MYLEAAREILEKYDGLWSNDESYVITRNRHQVWVTPVRRGKRSRKFARRKQQP